MKHKAFAARDSRLGVFHPPFFMQHTGQALRWWEELCNDPKASMHKYPSDFQLFEVGDFDDEKGLFYPLDAPHQIATATEARKSSEVPNLREA